MKVNKCGFVVLFANAMIPVPTAANPTNASFKAIGY